MKNRKLSRRDFLKLSGTASLGFILSACGVTQAPTATPSPTATAAPTSTA
ncbi:MAG: twin-arginine translocation signal domain-containing protein, partial [Anaerolineae bacterium]